MSLKASEIARFANDVWDQSIVPALCEYVRIPNKSPLFDPDWERHGHMERAVELLAAWCRRQPIAGLSLRIARLPGRTPLIFIEVPPQGHTRDDTVLLYGHLDKQPEFTGWQEGLGPWEPVIRDGRLYGRGAADDGYAVFSSLTAIAALQAHNIPHARCVVLIEACEESGSVDLPAHVEALAADIRSPSLVVCLDAEAGDYERLWLTTSLRGNLVGTLAIDLLTEGVHSGAGSGIAASCFDVLRVLLARLSNADTGEIRLAELHAEIPADRRREIHATARLLGHSVAARMPFVPGARAMSQDPSVLLENSTWRPTLTVTGLDGLPNLGNAGNVLAPRLTAKLSFRLPPTVDGAAATGGLVTPCGSGPERPAWASTAQRPATAAASISSLPCPRKSTRRRRRRRIDRPGRNSGCRSCWARDRKRRTARWPPVGGTLTNGAARRQNRRERRSAHGPDR